MTVGLVTVTYNSASVIDGFMDSVLAQDTADWRLYVIDNASRDDGLARVRRDMAGDARIALIANTENRGVAAGNNQGILAAQADGCGKILLINNDVEFGPDLLSGMLAAMRELGAKMLVPKIRYFEPSDMLWCAGGQFVRSRAFKTCHFGEGETDRGQFDSPQRIEYAPTCCMMINTSVFDDIGIMDERYFVYFDDADFCYRAINPAVSFWYSPKPIVYHKVSSLTGGDSDFTVFYNVRGQTYFARKHFRKISWVFLAVLQIKYVLRLMRLRPQGLKRFWLEQRAFRAGLAIGLPAEP
jgi:GT2 family glycosyltransferase